MHADVAARQRERIDAAVTHEEWLPGEALVEVGADLAALARRGDQRLEHALQVFEQHRIVAVLRIAADLPHDLVAELALAADAEVFGGGVAERRQLVAGSHCRQRRGPCQRRSTQAGQQAVAQSWGGGKVHAAVLHRKKRSSEMAVASSQRA